MNISERGVGAHNFFLTVTLDAGVIGLAVMLAFLAIFLRFISRTTIGPRQLNLGALFVLYWIPIALSGHWELAQFSWVVVAYTIQVTIFSGNARRNS